jgi:hypothetical protein
MGLRAWMRQFWSTACELPKMKSTVPEMVQSRKNWRMACA